MSCFALISMTAPHAKFYIIPFPFPIEAEVVCILRYFFKYNYLKRFDIF